MRAILNPAALSGAALDELKGWLAISSPADDPSLSALLETALEICEGFTGQMVLEAECAEVLPATPGRWQTLNTRPVQSITLAEGIPSESPRFALAASAYAVELDADGGARFRLIRQGVAGRVAVRFTAGMAEDWASLPDAIRHGVIRLAAHLFRQRDEGAVHSAPPTVVAALWRPWRRMRLL